MDAELFFGPYCGSPVVYHAEKGRTGKWFICCEQLNPYLMTGDYLLFESAEECRMYWESEGVVFDA